MKRKVMPCGYVRTGRLKEHLAHYRQCEHPACKERLKAWEDLKKQFIESQKNLGEK